MISKKGFGEFYDYGPLKRVPLFKGTHPAVMKEWMDGFDWQEQLRDSGPTSFNMPRSKHNKLKYRIISCIEKHLLFGARLGEFKNYIPVKG